MPNLNEIVGILREGIHLKVGDASQIAWLGRIKVNFIYTPEELEEIDQYVNIIKDSPLNMRGL